MRTANNRKGQRLNPLTGHSRGQKKKKKVQEVHLGDKKGIFKDGREVASSFHEKGYICPNLVEKKKSSISQHSTVTTREAV